MQRLLRYQDVADILQLHPRHIRRLVKKGDLRPVRLSHRVVRFSEADLARLITARTDPHRE